MTTHNLTQGTPEWHEHRDGHWNASDAPAMMGCSPYQTRTELLHQKSTGITPNIDEATQRRFDDGHRFEALARTLAEQIIGEDLYPVTVSTGRYSASMDGLNMGEDQSFEHKSLNDSIRAATSAQDLPEYLRIQMEHQFIASPGTSRCLFMASKWDSEGNLLEEKHFWYEPDLDLRMRIIAGWEQFEKDLADYVPFEIVEQPKAGAIKDLPAVTIQVRGELTMSNLSDVTPLFDRFLEEAKTNLVTDDDFALAESQSKTGRETAKRCKLTAKAVIDQIFTVSEAVRTLEEYAAKFDALALLQEKAVKDQKEARKTTAKAERDKAYTDHIAGINAEITPITLVLQSADKPNFVGVMKGQRMLSSIYNKLDTELARVKIAADAVAKDLRANLAWHKENSVAYEFLFADMQQIVYKPTDDFQMLVKNRIDQHKAEEKVRIERLAEQLAVATQVVVSQPALVPVTPQTPTGEAPKPATLKSAGSVKRDIPSRVDPLMLALARRDAEAFRVKFASIGGLSRVHTEIDAFPAATEPQLSREMVRA